MGRLTARLKEWKLDNNTLLIFMTDNGQAGRGARRNGKRVRLFTAGFKTGKGSPYEGGTCVPAFWRWKGVLPEGKDVDALTAHIDLFPTFAELTGAKQPAGQIKGRSVLALLEDPAAKWPDRYLFTHQGRWPKGADPRKFKHRNCAVRNARFRLVNDRELYDIASDPYEKTNVIGAHPEAVMRMRAAYDAWWAETLPLMVNESVPNAKTRPFFELYEKQLKRDGIPDWNPPEL